MAFNAFESIANDFSSTRKKLKRYSSSPEGLRPAAPPAPPPAAPPTPVAPARTPVAAPVTPLSSGVAEALAALQQPRPMAAQPTKMPTDVAVALGALQQRGEKFGVDTTEFNYAAPDWGKVAAQMGEVNKVFDEMDSEIEAPSFEGRQNGGLYGVIDRNLGSNYPHLFAESNPDASFWDRSIGRTTGAVGRGLRQTVGRPALGVGRAIGEVAQDWVGSNEEAIANLDRSEGEVVSSIFSDLGVVDPEQWNDLIKTEGQVKADLLLSRRILAEMGSSSFETGTQATSKFTDEENLARNQYRIKRLLEIDPATGKTRAEAQLKAGSNPAKLIAIPLALLEASEGVVTLGGRLALSQLGRQIDIANGGDGSKGEMWGDIIGSFVGSFPKNPAGAMRVGDGAGTIYRNADDVAAGLRATGRPVQQGSGIAAATGLDFAGSEVRDVGELAKTLAGPPLSGALRAGERYAEAVGRAGTGNVLDPAPPRVSRGMAEINEELQAKIDEIDRAFKNGDLTPLQYQEMLQAVGDPTVAPKSILPEGGILGDDFGKAPEGTVVTIDGVETRLGPDGKPIVETTAREVPTTDPYSPPPKRPKGLTALQERRRRIAEEDAAKAARPETYSPVPEELKDLDVSLQSEYVSLREAADGTATFTTGVDAGLYTDGLLQKTQGGSYRISPTGQKRLDEFELYIDPNYKAPKIFDNTPGSQAKNEPTLQQQVNAANSAVNADADTKLAQIKALDVEAKNSSMSPVEHQRRLQEINDGVAAPVAAEPFNLSPNQRHLLADEAFDDFRKLEQQNMGQTGLEAVSGFSESKRDFLGRMAINHTETRYGAVSLPDIEVSASQMAYLRDELLPALARKLDDQIAEGKKNPKEFVPGTQKTLKKVQAERLSVQKLIDKVGLAPVARVADDIPTSGQATLDGGVVAARTEQDIVDASTKQSGFDLTATGEDAPLRQAGEARGVGDVVPVTPTTPVGARATVFDPAGNPVEVTVSARSEMGSVEVTLDDGTTRILGASELDLTSPYSPDYKVETFGKWESKPVSELTDTELKEASARLSEVANVGDTTPGGATKLRDNNALKIETRRRAGEAPTTPATGTAAARQVTPPTSTDEVIINGKKYVEAPETPTEPVATTPEPPAAPVEPAPKNPIPADQVEKYDVQNGFDEFGQLSTYESTVAKPYGDLDSDLAQAEWDMKDADLPISDADYYAENELFEFDVNERLSEFPTYERNLDPDNPVHAVQIEVNRLEQRIDDSLGRVDDGVTGKKKTEEIKSDEQLLEDSRFPDPEQIAYQRELELETMATGRLQPWTKRLLGSQDGFPEEGLTPRQAFILIGESESQLPSMSGTTRIYKKDGKLTGGVAQPKAVDYQAWAKKKWGRPNLDASQSKAPYGPPREYYTAPKTSKEYKAARNPKNWKVDTTAIDELSSDITTIHPTYDPKIVGSEVSLSNFMRDVEAAKSARVEYNQIVADRKYAEDVATAGTREAKTEADKLAAESARRQLLIANEKLIETEDHIVMNYAGQRINTETGEILTKAPVSVNKALEGETVYVNARGEEISTEEYLASDVLDAGAVKANDINRQNPYSGTMSEGGQGVNPRSVEPVVGLYTAEEVALLPENLTARLVAQNISTQNPVRDLGTSPSGGQGVNPNAVDPVVGKGDPVEQGLEYPVAGTGRATQSSMAGTRNDTAREFHTDPVSKKLIDDFLAKSKAAEELRNRSKEIKPIAGTGDPLNPARGLDQNVGRGAVQTTQDVDERIRPSRMLPAKISSEEEAVKAFNGAFMMPNTDSKLQVGLAGMVEVFQSGGTRKMAEDVLVYNMPGEEIIPAKQFLAAVAEHKLDDIGEQSAWRLNPGTAANTVDRGQSIGPMTNSVIETTQRAADTKGRWMAVALDDWAKIPSRYGLSEKGTSVFKKALRSATRGIPKVEIIPKAERIKQKNILGYNSKPLWQFGNRSTAEPDDMTRLTKIMETLSGDADLDMDALKLVRTRPTVAKNVEGLTPVKQRAFIEAAKEGRILLDNIRIFQNKVRAARGQDPIAWRPDYMPNIKEANLWRALGQYTKDPTVIARQTPDFTKAGDKVFNARAMNLKHKMGENIRDMNADRLIRGYIVTASADVFDTEIVRNIKAHTKLMRKESTDEYSLENAAKFFDDYADQVYLKRPTRFTEWARGNALNARLPMGGDRKSMSLVDSALLLKKIVTVSTFPLNWTWNSFVQTSSGLLTPVRYGVRNSIKALDSFFDQEVKDQIALHAYTFRVKSQKGSSVVMQNTGEDAVFAFKPTKREQVIEFASFISNQIEKFLTRHAVRAAYLRGEQMGYKGAELWQYASQGGARTQSMYNKADTVASLRSREMSAIVPFQTFAFEMLNTLSEMNVPGLRNVIGKSGAYESFSANTAGGSATSYRRMKNIGLLVAGMVAWNVVADRTSNRKPWNLSSFLPFFAVMKQGVDGFGPGGAFLPAKFGYDVVQGFNKYYRSGDFSYLRTLLMRYTVVPGGTTVDKWLLLIDGLEDEAVRNPDRTIRFKVEKPEMTGIEFDVPFIGKKTLTDKKINPEEFLRVYGSGTWASNGGREELAELGYRNNQEGQSVIGKASSTLSNIVGLQNFPTIGKFNTNSLDRKYKKDLEFYYSIPSDPEEAAAAELPSRSYLRKNDPQLEAHLFIIGRVTALTKGTGALLITRELVIEYDLLSQGGGWFNGRKVTPKEELRYRKVLGEDWVNSVIGGSTDTGSSSPLDSGGGIAPLEFGSPDRSSGAEPQSSAPQTANEQWRLASTYLTRDNLVALQKIWDGEPVSRPESASLKAVFEKVPLGQTNFRKWSKQTLRQVHENATVQMPREAVTV